MANINRRTLYLTMTVSMSIIMIIIPAISMVIAASP